MPRHDQHCTVCDWTGEVWVKPYEHPPCPQCGSATERLWHQPSSVVGDDIPGGQWIENLSHEPMLFYSKQEIVREAKRRGLEPMVRHVEGDKHTTRWSTTDPYTLAAAEALVARVTTVRGHEEEPIQGGVTGEDVRRVWEQTRR